MRDRKNGRLEEKKIYLRDERRETESMEDLRDERQRAWKIGREKNRFERPETESMEDFRDERQRGGG
jgi:hypothetical protein